MASRPADRDINVLPDAFVAVDIHLPNAGKVVDAATLSDHTVRLYRNGDHQIIPAIVNTSGGGDDIVLRPANTLDLNTQYTFEVTPNVKDTSGRAFAPYHATFTTAAATRFGKFPAAFERVELPVMNGRMYTCVTFGPDHRLYASALTGEIFCLTLKADGTIESRRQIDAVIEHNGGPRLITGITFDPASTADRPLLWISHGQLPPRGEQGLQAMDGAQDWTGKISLISGTNLDEYRDVIVGLPRATKDHLNNQMAFGPDGAMYFCQASHTAMGAPDHKWGFRPERLLSSAILRLDTSAALAQSAPIDVKTEEGGHYDPTSAGAPLTIYATGIRNSFDLVWHSNGSLYAATNGSAAGGNTPASPDGTVPALEHVRQTEDDYLFRIERGAYYGHPNPLRAEYVLNGGNLTGGADLDEVAAYPGVGTHPRSQLPSRHLQLRQKSLPLRRHLSTTPTPSTAPCAASCSTSATAAATMSSSSPSARTATPPSEVLTGIEGLAAFRQSGRSLRRPNQRPPLCRRVWLKTNHAAPAQKRGDECAGLPIGPRAQSDDDHHVYPGAGCIRRSFLVSRQRSGRTWNPLPCTQGRGQGEGSDLPESVFRRWALPSPHANPLL